MSAHAIRTRGRRWLGVATVWTLAAATVAAVVWRARWVETHLGEPSRLTGFTLLGTLLLLGAFNLRKRLSVLPLGPMGWWTQLHLAAGAAAVALFWVHSHGAWPNGAYEQWLAVTFHATVVSGIAGWLIERVYPPRLTHTGVECIYERIPAELAEIRERNRRLLLECARETGSETLGRYYLETLAWFFRRPRFVLNHLWGGRRAQFWLDEHLSIPRQYLNDVELGYLERIAAEARRKVLIDLHYAGQLLMRAWLLVHVPAAAGLLALVAWHLLVVHVYAL